MKPSAEPPVYQIITALSVDNPDQIIPPEAIQTALHWTRLAKPDSANFSSDLALETDYQHLGFFDDKGVLRSDILVIARQFLKAHWTEPPRISTAMAAYSRPLRPRSARRPQGRF